MILNTERLTIRPVELTDAEFIMRLTTTEDFVTYIGIRDVSTVERTEEYIRLKMLSHVEKYGFGNSVMILRETGTKIGTVSLFRRDDKEGVDIGFALLPAFYGVGYAFEGANAMMNFAKDELKLPSITGYTTENNIRSKALLSKLGLKYIGLVSWGEEEIEYHELKF